MTSLELQRALDRWGGDLDRWPADLAAAARAHLARDREARRLLHAARLVDAHLAALQSHTAPAHLAARIAARARDALPAQDRLERMLGWLTGRFWRPAALAMLIVAAGYFTGYITGGATDGRVDPMLTEDVMTLAFSDIYAELENAQP